jgi:hypothetical protein
MNKAAVHRDREAADTLLGDFATRFRRCNRSARDGRAAIVSLTANHLSVNSVCADR